MKILLLLPLLLSLAFALQIPQTLQANFIQTVTNEHNQTLIYRGKIYYEAPYNSKWIYTFPSPKTICVSKENIIIIEEDLQQVTIYQNHNHIDFNQLYSDAVPVEKNKYITHFLDNQYHLTTKEDKIDSLSFVDALNNHSLIEFSSVVYNKEIPSLRCSVPSGFDIVIE